MITIKLLISIKSALTKQTETNSKSNSGSKLNYRNTLFACLPIFLVTCGFQQYTAKPVSTDIIAAKIENKNPDSAQFHQFLINHGYLPERLPIQQWGVDELTFCALFFHPSLDVARAQWRAAESAQLTAAEKAAPTLNGHLAHSSNTNNDVSPYAFGLSIDIPIETANKRAIRIENASHLSQAAKLEIAQVAWQLRNQVAQSLYEYQFNQQQIYLLSKEQAYWQEIVAIYQKRISLGAASNLELSTATLQLQTITAKLNAHQQNKLVLLSKLANHSGLPLRKLETMPLAHDSYKMPNHIRTAPENLNAAALLNRLDIRISLERYAAAEAKLKLEIAKQYPDLIISPGYAYEFGDKIWSLGLSGLLTLLNKNKLAIAEATQLREIEAAQFEALQNTVIAEADTANAKLAQARQVLEQQATLYQQQQNHTQRMARKLSAGEIDRLELTYVKLEEVVAERNVALAHFQLKTALNQLENALQQPQKQAAIN